MSRCYHFRLPGQRLAGVLRPGDTIIACDAGYRNCAPLHCRPDIIVGRLRHRALPGAEATTPNLLPHVKDEHRHRVRSKLASEKGFDEALLLVYWRA